MLGSDCSSLCGSGLDEEGQYILTLTYTTNGRKSVMRHKNGNPVGKGYTELEFDERIQGKLPDKAFTKRIYRDCRKKKMTIHGLVQEI